MKCQPNGHHRRPPRRQIRNSYQRKCCMSLKTLGVEPKGRSRQSRRVLPVLGFFLLFTVSSATGTGRTYGTGSLLWTGQERRRRVGIDQVQSSVLPQELKCPKGNSRTGWDWHMPEQPATNLNTLTNASRPIQERP